MAQVVQQRQQGQRDVFAAAEQTLEIGGQLHHRTRQRFDALLGLRLVLRFGQPPARLLHLVCEQCCAVDLDYFEGAPRDVQVLRGAQQRVGARAAVDVILELAAGGIERARELSVDELERMRSQIVHRVSGHAHLPSPTDGGARRLDRLPARAPA